MSKMEPMALSSSEKKWVQKVYERNRIWTKFGPGGLASALVGLAPMVYSSLRTMEDPHTSRWVVILLSGGIGLALGIWVMVAFASVSRRKYDQEMIQLVENHFPEECPWKQEEALLAEAQQIQAKAIVDLQIRRSNS